MTAPLHCGHPVAHVRHGDGGAAWCGDCEDAGFRERRLREAQRESDRLKSDWPEGDAK